MKIGIIGSGVVAQTLATGFLKHGHQVMVGTREPAKLDAWHITNGAAAVGSVPDTAKFGELIILAVKGSASLAALGSAGTENLDGKIIVDSTNPIADLPPVNGVLQFFTDINGSLMEQLQQEFPAAHFVKAFNSVGSAQMINPNFAGGRPTMFICGNSAAAKHTVRNILDQFGWETADMGKVESARAIEPLCMLWCVRGFLDNQWNHAFKMLT